MHEAILDRMNIIEFKSYSVEEKVTIAQKKLLPKHALSLRLKQLSMEDQTLQFLIRNYTFEGGVRKLEQRIVQLLQYICFDLQAKQ